MEALGTPGKLELNGIKICFSCLSFLRGEGERVDSIADYGTWRLEARICRKAELVVFLGGIFCFVFVLVFGGVGFFLFLFLFFFLRKAGISILKQL